MNLRGQDGRAYRVLDAAVVYRQLEEARLSLAAWADALGQGKAPHNLPMDVRNLNDLLTCLLDESPNHQHAAIHYLIDRSEALSTRLAN